MKDIKPGDIVLIKCRVNRVIYNKPFKTEYYVSLADNDADMGYVIDDDIVAKEGNFNNEVKNYE